MCGVETTRMGFTQGERDFVDGASQVLRDPLTVCRAFVELFEGDPEEQRTTIALVLDELDRMARMVDDLQLLAEAEQPDFLQPEWIDLELFIHELTAKATALAPRNWTLEHAAQGVLRADDQHLTEAMMNLARNAAQHTREDDTVAIGVSLNEHEARLWVRDDGPGVAVADRERIFDLFERGKDAHRRYRGGGLGLAVVKAIAEAHGGRVELESYVGEGSTFTIILPVTRAEQAPGSEAPSV
jgi:two-component system, OmpR family, sensor kinase